MNARQQEIDTAIRASGLADIWLSELRVGCGYGPDSERIMDLWGISTKRPFVHIAVEIKVSRGDFRSDLRSPLKQRRARLFANLFYYAAPSGLLTASDLPPWAGLLEVASGVGCYIKVKAPWFDSSPPTWSFVAHLLRIHGRDKGQVMADQTGGRDET